MFIEYQKGLFVMKKHNMIVIILALAAMVILNVAGIYVIDKVLAKPQSAYKIEVLGATFKEEVNESNVIDMYLVRPPRVAVFPGETTELNSFITNEQGVRLAFKASYRIDVEDADGKVIDELDQLVEINMHPDWEYRDGYWYYPLIVEYGEKIPGPIESITYSTKFVDYLDHDVYIPLCVESIVVSEEFPTEKDWCDIDVNKIDVRDYITRDSWSQTVTIE